MVTVIQIMDRFKKAVTRKISKYLIYCNKTQVFRRRRRHTL